MKKILLLVLIVQAISVYGQTFDYSKSLEGLKEWEEVTGEVPKMAYVNKLKEGREKECYFENFRLEDFHIIDFDRDGLNDVLYYGYCGYEKGKIAVFRFNGESFDELLFVWGNLFQVSDNNNNLPFSFTVMDYACCGGIIRFFEKYVLVLKDGVCHYQLQSREDFQEGTKFPDSYLDKPIAFRTVREKYNLRISPEIDNKPYNEGPYQGVGNIVCGYSENSVGYAIAEKKDETGRVWWFVKMDNRTSKGMGSGKLKNFNNQEPTYTLGWMSSRYVELISGPVK